MSVFTISFINFHFQCILFFSESNITKSYQEWGYFQMDCHDLKLVLYHHTSHPVSSSKDHSLQFQVVYRLRVQDTTFSISFYPTHTTFFLQIQLISSQLFYSVLANPDKAPTPNAGIRVPVRNEIISGNAGKNPLSIFMLWGNCVFLHSYCHAFLFFIRLHQSVKL